LQIFQFADIPVRGGKQMFWPLLFPCRKL
jgi:hypothetical protein